ncbi:MAG: sugar ABC transporter ATP-binding protein [Negativicutes bacterium]|nr:sugar ABC transporter ATP-binding protein [Negativicutes bacterium]
MATGGDRQPSWLELRNISKTFPGVRALSAVSLAVRTGEIHCLCGENGAGKSTLIKIMTGVYQPDPGGVICVGGQPVSLNGTRDAAGHGIACIYQELSLADNMSVTDNIFLGRELRKAGGLLDRARMRALAADALAQLGVEIDIDQPAGSFSMGVRQAVEIARALLADAKLLIMDEPTSSLSGRETDLLLDKVRQLRNRGIAVVYISHRLDEVAAIADRVTVLRDGQLVGSMDRERLDIDEIVRLMVGRDVSEHFPKLTVPVGDELLRVENLCRAGVLHDISFSLHRGEVLGLAGLIGAGRTEAARAIFGADPVDSGRIWVNGREVFIRSPRDAINSKIALLTEDRKGQGLVLMHDVQFNIELPVLERFNVNGLIARRRLNGRITGLIEQLRLRPPDPRKVTRLLSGGNQQKVVIAKWLLTEAEIFIFDEPTRGIDVGAKIEVYNLIGQLVSRGAAVVVISSELPEVMGISDRILVMSQGRITGEFSRREATAAAIMQAATANRPVPAGVEGRKPAADSVAVDNACQ